MVNSLKFIEPNWPAPKNIKALCTTRIGGVSLPPFNSFNVATHVEDNPQSVAQNRQLLMQSLNLPAQPFWLDQQHTDIALELKSQSQPNFSDISPPIADASWTMQPSLVSLVMTADCLPILVTDLSGSCVAAIHAGWKGLADGVVSKTINAMPVHAEELMAWIGPAISARQFEVGEDVLQAFMLKDKRNQSYFKAKEVGEKYLADLPGLVGFELESIGVKTANIYQSNLCSYESEELFYSYRRDGKTGRMASLIWIE